MTDELSKLFRDAMDWGRSYGQRLNTPYELLDEVATQFADKARAIEAAAVAPLLERIAAQDKEIIELQRAVSQCLESCGEPPAEGSALERLWMFAMGDPLSVPDYVKAKLAQRVPDVGAMVRGVGWGEPSAAPAAPEQPSMTPEQVREGIANHIEDVFLPEKVWTVLQTAAYIRSIEINGKPVAQTPNAQQAEPTSGNWIAADDYRKNVKDLDVALNGQGGAERPALIDVLSQVEQVAREHGMPVLVALAQQAEAQEPCAAVLLDLCADHCGAVEAFEFLPKGTPLFTRPQPAQLQRQPLTIAEVEAILARWSYELHGDRARFIVRETELAHGIRAAAAMAPEEAE